MEVDLFPQNVSREVKFVLIPFVIVLVFYVVLSLVSYYTSSHSNRPPHPLLDNRRNSNSKDILEDSYWNIRKRQESND